MSNRFDNMIFYDRESGKVITDEVMKSLNERTSIDTILHKGTRVGMISRDKAVVIDDIVQNITHSKIAEPSVAEKETDDLDLDIPFDFTKRRETNKSNADMLKEKCYENARRKSATPNKQSVQRQRQHRKAVSRTVIMIGLTAIITIAAYIGANKLAEKMTDNYQMNKATNAVTTLVTGLDKWHGPTIVSRNTHRTENFQGFWFDNSAIASDILEMTPDAAFDATLYTVYNDMGVNVKNDYIDNFSRVISALGKGADPEKNPLAYARTSGCTTFEEFAIKNGLVDETGAPSKEKYIEFGKNAVAMYYEYLQNAARGPVDENGDPELGGRK